MKITILPIDYRNFTWKQVFETIQTNIETLYNAILGSYTDVEVEQFLGPADSVTIESPADEDTEWLVFRNHSYLGKREGGTGYIVEDQNIIFDSPLTSEEQVTVLITNGNGISVLADKYIAEIQEVYNKAKDLDVDIVSQINVVQGLKDYLDESAEGILDAKGICLAVKDYIEQLLNGVTPDHGDFADEMVAARREFPLLGARLDTLVSYALERTTFFNSIRYRDGDWVIVKDGKNLYIYMVKDEYHGTLPITRMITGQLAVEQFSTEMYADTRELTERVAELERENQAQNLLLEQLSSRLLVLESQKLDSRIKDYEARTLMDLNTADEE